MYTICKTVADKTHFIIGDAPQKYHQAIRSLAFQEIHNGFVKSFPSDTPYLDSAYVHFSENIETIIKQSAKELPVNWEAAFQAFLQRTYHLKTDWWVAGSLALALRGLPIVPGDIDLIVDKQGSYLWGDALSDVLVEPVAPTGGWFCESWGRAFLHTRIEWVGGVDPDYDISYVRQFYNPSVNNLETIHWRGYDVRIPPLEPQLHMDAERGRTERVKLMQAALKAAKAA